MPADDATDNSKNHMTEIPKNAKNEAIVQLLAALLWILFLSRPSLALSGPVSQHHPGVAACLGCVRWVNRVAQNTKQNIKRAEGSCQQRRRNTIEHVNMAVTPVCQNKSEMSGSSGGASDKNNGSINRCSQRKSNEI